MAYSNCKFCKGNGCLACPGERKKDADVDTPAKFLLSRFNGFLNNKTWLITGEGRLLSSQELIRLFMETPQKATRSAKAFVDLSRTNFISVIDGNSHSPLSASAIHGYKERACDYYEYWPSFWMNHALLQLCRTYPSLRNHPKLEHGLTEIAAIKHPTEVQVIDWLLSRLQCPVNLLAMTEMRTVDEFLGLGQAQPAWLFYSGLDFVFRDNTKEQGRFLSSLLAMWLELNLDNIHPKIFLGEGTWGSLDFTNKGHYWGHMIKLKGVIK